MMRRRLLLAASALLMAVAAWQLAAGGWIHAKAWLARGLIDAAWARASAGEAHPRPWPWADTWPVARLQVPRLGVERTVLSGSSGRVMAFGPGHVAGTPAPGEPGNTVLTGHRDTHFRFLRHLHPGDIVRVDRPDGLTQVYEVTDTAVVRETDTQILEGQGGDTVLVLLTCWPFDALRPGGSMRYVVTAMSRQ
ncbi:MAG: class GN sortase [Chromatiales bacterium]|jgi:sortase A